MPDANATSCTLSPAEIIAAAAKWGRTHGRLWASLEGVREAVLAGQEVDWCDWPEVFWDDIGVSTEDMLPLLSEELQQAGEHAAWAAAKAEGERCCRELTEEELLDLIDEEFAGDQGE